MHHPQTSSDVEVKATKGKLAPYIPTKNVTKLFPFALPPMDFGNHLAKSLPKQERPGAGGNIKHVCPVQSKATALAWPRQRIEDGRIPNDMLYGKLATGTRPEERHVLRYKDVFKRDMKASNISPTGWEAVSADRCRWRLAVRAGIRSYEKRNEEQGREKRSQTAEGSISIHTEPSAGFTCRNCNRD